VVDPARPRTHRASYQGFLRAQSENLTAPARACWPHRLRSPDAGELILESHITTCLSEWMLPAFAPELNITVVIGRCTRTASRLAGLFCGHARSSMSGARFHDHGLQKQLSLTSRAATTRPLAAREEILPGDGDPWSLHPMSGKATRDRSVTTARETCHTSPYGLRENSSVSLPWRTCSGTHPRIREARGRNAAGFTCLADLF
jgi:hypothetical protein